MALPDKNKFKDYNRYSGLAFQLFAILLVGYFVGAYLDRKIQLSKPIFTAACMVLALFVYFYLIIRDTKR